MTVIRIVSALALIFSANLYGHSGGTDRNGCHAGSRPYHCHNGSGSGGTNYSGNSGFEGLDAWDLNFGLLYKYKLPEIDLYPHIGLSLGSSSPNEDIQLGLDIGLNLRTGAYIGYATTSRSLQLGFKVVHLSVADEFVGLGISFPFGSKLNTTNNGHYVSFSGLF